MRARDLGNDKQSQSQSLVRRLGGRPPERFEQLLNRALSDCRAPVDDAQLETIIVRRCEHAHRLRPVTIDQRILEQVRQQLLDPGNVAVDWRR